MFYALLTIFAAAVAAVDQWTKVLAQQYLTGTTVTIIPGWLQLHYITNDGMALSLFRGGRWMFVALTAVYLAVVVWAIAKKHIYKKPELWCLAAITGGAIGNLIDRVQTGLVIDMICIPWFSTFNVADLFITIPAVLLVLYILIWDKEFLSDKKPESGGKTGAPEPLYPYRFIFPASECSRINPKPSCKRFLLKSHSFSILPYQLSLPRIQKLIIFIQQILHRDLI